MSSAAGGGPVSNVVDLYNVATGAWWTAQLSLGRRNLAAASVGNVALFAGGVTASALLGREGGFSGVLFILACVFCVLRVLQYCGSVCPATASSLTRATSGGGPYAFCWAVDLYNVTTGAWSTAQLSVSRVYLAAASVGNVALFAGGNGIGPFLFRDGLVGVVFCCLRVLCFARAAVFRFCLPCGRFFSHARHCRF
jgi:hypothetical protein